MDDDDDDDDDDNDDDDDMMILHCALSTLLVTTLSEFVELAMGDRSMNYSRNRISWDIVCWAFGLKHEQGI